MKEDPKLDDILEEFFKDAAKEPSSTLNVIKKEDKLPWWLWALNFIILQWFFVRRAAVVENGKVVSWCWFIGVVPLTGWFGLRYRYITKP